MYRYLALSWKPAQERAQAAADLLVRKLESSGARWSRVLSATGLRVFHADHGGASDATLLDNSRGVVLGRVFTRDIDSPRKALAVGFNEEESARLVASGGRLLFEQYWGRYVAIMRDDVTDGVWVLRDPSGCLPCWYLSHEGVGIVCSDIDDCTALGLAPFTVNWDYIAGLVAHATQQSRDTGLNEVTEVQPGERLHLTSVGLRRTLEWNPLEVALHAPLESAEDAVRLLRATTIGCVHTWAAVYPGIIHNLSGGLDSAIVLSCLMSAPARPRVTCLNYFAAGPGEDERRYARVMADRVDVDLIERELDPRAVPLRNVLNVRCSPRPWFYLYELEHGAYEGELATARGATGLFSGAGGDGVFYQARADLAVADYLFAHGLRKGLLPAAIDAARMSSQSIWPLLWRALVTWLTRPEWDPVGLARPAIRTLVSPEALAAVKHNERLASPWLSPAAVRGVAPGVLWHILCLSLPPAYYNSCDRADYPERTLPLLSQPLVELCLRIPSYVLIRGGRDRALARAAFSVDLPAAIVRRHAKGAADRHFRNVLDANLDFVRELLLDGLLVEHGLLDRTRLELYLTRERSPADFEYLAILQEYVCTEAWLRRCSVGARSPRGRLTCVRSNGSA